MRTIKFRNERREKILGLLLARRRLSVQELSRKLSVTGATIRADLEALGQDNKVIRTYGGALLPNQGGAREMTMDVRLRNQVVEKQAIARLAASLIKDGMVIALDASTTSLGLSRFLKNRKSLTVITTSVAVAHSLVDAPGVNVVLPGGTLRHESAGVVGPEAVAFLSRLEVEIGFMGAHSVHAARGLGEVSQSETEIKRMLASVSRRVVALADSTKWNRVSISFFWPLDKVDTLVTEGPIPKDVRDALKAKNVKLLTPGKASESPES